MQASQLWVEGVNWGIEDIWRRRGPSLSLNNHPALQAEGFVVVTDGTQCSNVLDSVIKSGVTGTPR